MRQNRTLEDYTNMITNLWRESTNNGEKNTELWYRYQQLDEAQRIHDIRNNNTPIAYYDGDSYTIDDAIPYEATVYVLLHNSAYANNIYLDRGESVRDWFEQHNENLIDLVDWWME